MIHGNTGELYQRITIAAEQLAGPAFEWTTGTLRERLEETIRRAGESKWNVSWANKEELCRLLNDLKVDDLRRSKPR